MILVDTSALLEFYREGGRPEVAAAVADSIASGEVAVNGMIMVEVMAFARDEDIGMLEDDFSAFHFVDVGPIVYREAARLGRDLRRAGVTVPATDLVIAATALVAGIPLLHADEHFDLVARHAGLDVRSPAKAMARR